MKLALSLLVMLVPGVAQAQVFDSLYEVCDYPATSTEARVIDATAMMVPEHLLSQNPDNSYNISNYALTSIFGYAMCVDDYFYSAPTAGAGRTAVLIGRNRMMTAPHGTGFDPSGFAIVFREVHAPGPSCSSWDWSNIPEDRVYFPKSTGATNHYIWPKHDFSTFELDRYVLDRKPIKPRRSGTPRLEDPLFRVGHSVWSTPHAEGEGFLTGFVPPPHGQAGSGRYREFHPLYGDSGSAIYNLRDEVIDTVVANSIDGTGHFDGTCYSFRQYTFPESIGNPTNGPIVELDGVIPRAEVKVAPIDDVLHVADIGQALAQPVTNYVFTAALGSNQYEIMPVNGAVFGGPTLTGSQGAGYGVLSPFNPLNYSITASTAAVTACGVWDMHINVMDAYHEQNNYLRHRFEIGMHEVAIDPPEGWVVGDLDAPFTQTKTYTLTNLRPSATTIDVSTFETGFSGIGGGWLKVNGVNMDSVVLAAAGSPGDSDTVTLTIAPGAAGYAPLNPRNAAVKFEYADESCGITGPIQFASAFTKGRQAFIFEDVSDTQLIPPTSTPFGPVYSAEIDLTGNGGQCIDDANFSFGIFDHDQLDRMTHLANFLKIVLISPSATAITLWDRDALPTSLYTAYENGFSTLPELTLGMLYLDDESTPPTVDLLSILDGEDADGVWEIQMQLGTGGPSAILPLLHRLTLETSDCP